MPAGPYPRNVDTTAGLSGASNDFTHFCQVAVLVMVVYDHALTFDREVEYIWNRRWSKSKALFLLARYFGHFLLISVCIVFLNRNAGPLVSVIGLKVVGTGSMITILITQVIMQLRIKALYGKRISTLITIAYALEVVAVLSLGIASLLAIDVSPYTLQEVKMCNPTYLPRFAVLFWVPVITFETFLFSLAFRIGYHTYLDIGNWRGESMIHIVLRDNFSFFICAFVAYIITAVTWLTANPRYFTVPGAFSCALTTIMGCRLILNLCEAYHNPLDPIGGPTNPNSIWAANSTRPIRFVSINPTAGALTTVHPKPPISVTRGPGPQTHSISLMDRETEGYELDTLGISSSEKALSEDVTASSNS